MALLSQWGTFPLYPTVISFPATCDCCLLAFQCHLLGRVMFCPKPLYYKGELLTHFQLVFHQHPQVFSWAIPPILFWWIALLLTSARMWIYLHWISWSICQPFLQLVQVSLNRGSAHLSISCSSLKFMSYATRRGCNSSSTPRLYNPSLCYCFTVLQCYVNELVLHHFLLE